MIMKKASKIFMVSVLIASFSNGLSSTCSQIIPGTKAAISIKSYLEALNSRFNNTDPGQKCSNGNPLYMCTGVLVHTIENIDHPKQSTPPLSSVICPFADRPSNVGWCPSTPKAGEKGKGRVSFSYLRKDIMPTTGQIIYNYDSETGPTGHKQVPGVGYILDFSGSMKSHLSDKSGFSLLCSYPADGATITRSNFGCAPALDENFYNEPAINYFEICGNPPAFGRQHSIDADHFDYFISVAKQTSYLDMPHDVTCNEFVISSWEGYKYKAIPLQAFYYVTHDESMKDDVSKSVAYTEADLYYEATGKYVPVVAIDMVELRKAKASDVNVKPFICPEPPPKV